MVKKNPYRPYSPDPEFMSLWPDGVSGNDINGVGETEVRRPDIVWWATEHDDISFAEMQQCFYQHEPADEALMLLRRQRRDIIDAPLPDLADNAVQQSPQDWTKSLDYFIDQKICEKVGVTKLREEWVYAHHSTAFNNVILLGVAHDYEELSAAPTLQAGIEVTHQYCRAAAAAKQVAGWLRQKGWDAEPVTGPMVGKILMIPHALEAGFGELGKHGSLINPEFGSNLYSILFDPIGSDTPMKVEESIKEAVKVITEFNASTKRICVCTDDRDADDLFNFGLDWVVRQANDLGINKTTAWSMGSLHPATRYNIDRDYGGLGHSRRADIVMLDENLKVLNTWLGGHLAVENNKITSSLDEQLTNQRYKYPSKAYNTVHIPDNIQMIPEIPKEKGFKINVIRTQLPGIVTFKEQIQINELKTDWSEILTKHNLCHLCVIERHNKVGDFAHGFLKDFNLKKGAVASSVGHDAHNIIVAGLNAEDMQCAVDRINETQGGIVIIENKKLIAEVQLPIAGLLSDKKASEVADENIEFKKSWVKAGCTLPYMGFNLLPLSVIPNFRITNKGLVDVNSMELQPLFE